MVKSVPSPSIFSASLPKVRPTSAGMLISVVAVRLISLPDAIVISVPSPVRYSPPASNKYEYSLVRLCWKEPVPEPLTEPITSISVPGVFVPIPSL